MAIVIQATSNGQELNLGDEFIHDGRKWVITHFDLTKKDDLKYFYAIDEDLAEIAEFESYDPSVIELTGVNHKDIYNLKTSFNPTSFTK